MTEKIKKYLKESKTIAILCHINADGDALCSSYALADALSATGKEVVCVLEEEPGRKYDFLGGTYTVFDSSFCRVFDLCIAVDCGGADRLGNRQILFEKAKHTINIDHHKTNTSFAEINVVKPTYCAAAEVLAELFDEVGLQMTDNVARLLYGGIMSDSGCLKFSNITPETHRTVARLMEHSFDHSEVTRMLFDNNSMEITKLTGFVMNNVESYDNGLITLISTDSKLLAQYGVDERDANHLINIPRSISGAEIAIELKERGGAVRVSLRSNGVAEVDRVAAHYGGGGHVRAAGATMKDMDLCSAKTAILQAAREELKRVGL